MDKKMIRSLFALLLCLMVMAGAATAEQGMNETQIVLSDAGVTVNGAPAGEDSEAAVYAARDIVFYLEGQDFTYGEGEAADGHSQAEADAHTVVHITKPGTYRVSGALSAGQIAVDLGEDAKKDESAVVTLILDGADITCTVAPAVIFYDVYECGDSDADNASKDVDTSAAGANVVIADGSVNTVSGSYVARIYKSVELSEDGSEIVSSKKLHKYDGAFYSKRSMNIYGGEKGDGVLNINAENEGLDSEMHLTILGGVINIRSGNDGINTNEDNVSVCRVKGGEVNITVTGATGEGDGIDSNGWLVVSGGKVNASACAFSADAGIDSDMGIYIEGGEVIASGNMLDHISGGAQRYAAFQFASRMKGGAAVTLKDAAGSVVGEYVPENDYTYLIVAGDAIVPGTYTLWQGDVQLSGSPSEMRGMMMPMGGFGGGRPDGFEPPEGFDMPKDFDPGKMPPPEGFDRRGGQGFGGRGGRDFGGEAGETSVEFVIEEGGSVFAGVGPAGE